MEDWKRSFSDKLREVQNHWIQQFETKLDNHVTPMFDDLSAFVRNHGFNTSIPMHEEGRRSFKFELAENAYLLLIFRSTSIGEFELRTESFTPGHEPLLGKSIERLSDVDDDWTTQRFQQALDAFVEHLGGEKKSAVEDEALAAV